MWFTMPNPIAVAAEEKLTATDKIFMTAAAEGGMLEVRLGEIAMTKGSRQDVKRHNDGR